MEAKVFIIAFPTMETVAEKISSLIEEAFDKPKTSKCERKNEFEPLCDFTPKNMRINEPCGDVHPWGVSGTPMNKDLRFGAEFAVDEPRAEDYDSRWEFEDDHEAFDRFVDAGEDCVARGLARPNGVTAHRCEAIRQPIGCPPPMNVDLIGETDWWSTAPRMWGC